MDERVVEVLEGIISVKAAIEGKNREIYNVFVDGEKFRKRDRKICAFVSYLKANNIRPELCDRGVIDAYVGEHSSTPGNTHGGVCASVSPRSYATVDEVLSKTIEETGFCIYLDGVEDPFNLGYAYRSLYAAGASGIILPERDMSSMSGILARSSAGASELLYTAQLSDCNCEKTRTAFVSKLRNHGITIACSAVSSTATPIFEYDGSFPMILFIGGEKRGISPEFIDSADELLYIPYANGNIRYSLPTASVAAISSFELMRVKNSKK